MGKTIGPSQDTILPGNSTADIISFSQPFTESISDCVPLSFHLLINNLSTPTSCLEASLLRGLISLKHRWIIDCILSQLQLQQSFFTNLSPQSRSHIIDVRQLLWPESFAALFSPKPPPLDQQTPIQSRSFAVEPR
jgi:hypothetical protein